MQLNYHFSHLLSQYFRYRWNMRRALPIGIDCNSMKRAPWRDVALVHQFITQTFNFSEDEVVVNKDDDADNLPTKQTIMQALHNLTHDIKAGDTLLFYFSGHNTTGLYDPSLFINDLDSIPGILLVFNYSVFITYMFLINFQAHII